MKATEKVREIHRIFDEKFAALPHRFPITCCKGCHACCAEPLLVNEAEADYLITAIPPQELDGVNARTQEWVFKFLGSGLANVDSPHVIHWLSARLMCPLLKDGLCLVYEQRPLGCRGHNAIGDPKLCHSLGTRLRQKYVISPELNNGVALMLMKACPTSDHLGAFLANKLLAIPLKTAARIEVME